VALDQLQLTWLQAKIRSQQNNRLAKSSLSRDTNSIPAVILLEPDRVCSRSHACSRCHVPSSASKNASGFSRYSRFIFRQLFHGSGGKFMTGYSSLLSSSPLAEILHLTASQRKIGLEHRLLFAEGSKRNKAGRSSLPACWSHLWALPSDLLEISLGMLADGTHL